MNENITIISSEKNWMEQSALDQLKQVASLPGVVKAVGLPDLHPGKIPVGACFMTEGIIYPHIIGNDIGCGMSFYMTGIEKRKIKIDRWVKKLQELSSMQEIEISDITKESCKGMPENSNLGTIGGGNHFAELQELQSICDIAEFEKMHLRKNNVMLLVHSGSRGLGASILDKYLKNFQAQSGLMIDSTAAEEYLEEHDMAIDWAKQNRDLIAFRMLKALSLDTAAAKIVDCIHNNITPATINGKSIYIHRKGAAPSDIGPIVIPGSRGALTYLVMPMQDTSYSGYSLAHGAGRKWPRGICKSKLEEKYTKETIKHTKLKGRILCNDRNLLYEEAPEAYKNIETVIQDLVDAKLIKVIATYKPILTYKA